ncbi:MAG: xanthine dehydrogenase family protein molybdopterin-binding subunit [Anaerolineales bacterium]|nr:xanthine dehydrogenase family protein molybdopterin-binding subunit [Anaerolineales bacterium]MCB0017799.1 xanthine dehydrogenase family protein molybdopterin-binding subunit [Anaerolineales bacterium]MCB8960578.1 xanthine dehydrogenase family protein molybdopterin-binding subunit [Ardenticatenales bacterium]
MGNYMGKRMKRVEDPRFIQGRGRYVANLQLPNTAHAAILRSPYAHAVIKSIDTSAAAAMDGVIAVYTGADLEGVGSIPCGFTPPDIKLAPHMPLATDKVRHVGDGVAMVVAETTYAAHDALAAIEVDYEPLPAVVDAKKTTEAGAPQVHDEIPGNVSFHWPLGDRAAVQAALSASDHVIELDLTNSRLVPNAMEPRACVAHWDDWAGEMTVYTTSQNPHIIRLLLSAFTLLVPENRLRVVSPDVGGGFGSKIFHYAEEILMPWASQKLKRPVKWVSTRSEAFITDAHGRDHVTSAKLGVNSDGTFTALDVSTWANMGAYLSTFAPMIPTALYITLFSGLYKIPVIYGEAFGTMTNTVPVDAYRGAGRPEASYMLERLIDIAARKLNMDPIAIRRKNFIQPDEFPYQTPVALVYDSGEYDKLFDKAMEVSGYNELIAARDAARAEGRLVGVGVSGCIEASGPAPSRVATSLGAAVGLWEAGTIRVHPTGKITVLTGTHSHGQGHETTFAQIVADELGVPVEDVEVLHGDTSRTPFGLGTYGSRSAAVGGSALVKSAEKIRDKMKRIAAHQLEAAVEDIVYDRSNGTMYVTGAPDQNRDFATIAFSALTADIPEDMEPSLEEMATYDPANFTFPNSAHICMVELDKDTCEVKITHYTAVDDVGSIINPLVVEGQVQGGIVQGVGQALLEHGVYDDNGQLLSGTMLDYAMPRADNMPMTNLANTVTPSPHNPLGVKGAGEMGTIAATVTVANAVMDALAPAGITHLDMPLTAQKLHAALNSNGGGD